MNIADEIERLRQLHETGAMSDDEFARAKDALLKNAAGGAQSPEVAADVRERQVRQWSMFLHLSLLAGFIVPLAGLIVPIVIWQVKKTDLPELDIHGKIVVNWIISLVIYAAVSAVLVLVVIGVPLLVTLGILAVVFPIIGGIKASNGEAWRYPLSLQFLN